MKHFKTHQETTGCQLLTFIQTILLIGIISSPLEYFSQAPPAVIEAAKKGNPEAQYQVGFHLCTCVISRDECPVEEALERIYWLTLSSDQGHSGAQTLLATMYYKGCGVEVNLTKAFELDLKSAKNGNCQGMNNLAVKYLLGEGTKPDLDKAIYWIKKMRDKQCDGWDWLVKRYNLHGYL